MNDDLVSIVVAIYKSENFLEKLIQSIRDQTYSNLDIILVDDGSPDSSGAICDKHAKLDRRIRVIHKKNGGACAARNTGIAAAKGEYLCIVDGDDWLAPDYVEYLLHLIHRPGVNMSMTDSIFTTRDMRQNETDDVVDLTSEEAICSLIYPRVPIGPWNKMYRLEMLKRTGITFSTKWSGEGLYYTVMAAQAAGRVAMGHRRIYYYRMNNENSGLTHYNVEMGLNAQENIQLIKDCLNVRTPSTLNACDWHIWKNYGYTLFLIIATGQQKKFTSRYHDCIQYMRKHLLEVLVKSDVKASMKFKMVLNGLMPILYSKCRLYKERKDRRADVFNKKD